MINASDVKMVSWIIQPQNNSTSYSKRKESDEDI